MTHSAMYVCLCNGVTETAIRQAAAAGCRSVDELTMRTGCGSTCGCCLAMAADLLAESSQPPPPPARHAPMHNPFGMSAALA